jgi:hypothetical protein
MNKDNKYIDEFANKLLLNKEVEAPAGSWERLAGALETHPKRGVLFFSKAWKIAAAFIIGILISSLFIFYPEEKTEQPIAINTTVTDTISKEINTTIKTKKTTQNKEAEKFTEISTTTNIIEKKDEIAKPKQKTNYTPPSEREQLAFKRLDIILFNKHLNTPSLISTYANIQLTSNESSWKATMADELLAKTVKEDNSINKYNEWKIGLAYSPTYASTNTSPTQKYILSPNASGSQKQNIAEKSNTTFTVGINIAYALNKRLSIQSGVYYQKQQNEIQNKSFINTESSVDASLAKSNSGNIKLENNLALFDNSDINNLIGVGNNFKDSEINSNLYQNFAFLEIPLIISYKFIDAKYSLSLQTGIHTGFIVGNSVYLKNFESTKIGTTENINSVIFRSVFGLSFEYPLSKRFYFNFSPSYKYQLNNLNKSINLNSKYNFIDIKTGITFRF